MTETYKLFWVPVGKAKRAAVPYRLDSKTGKLVYSLSPKLPFGFLEFQGVNISGYFKPDDDESEYSIRPWMFD